MGSERRPLIVHIVHSLEGGGTERTLVTLLGKFDPSRRDHAVITLRQAGSLAARLPDHVSCRSLGARGRSRLIWLRLAQALRACNPAVVHARNLGCWFDSMLAAQCVSQTQLVLGFHGLEHAGSFSRRQKWIARSSQRAGARFATVSMAGRQRLHEESGIHLENIEVLSNGVDLSYFRPPQTDARRRVRSTLHLSETAFVIGIVGALTPVKGHHALLRGVGQIVRSIPGVQLVMVGDGPLRADLGACARADGIGGRVHFVGQREDVSAMLSALDVYVCNSEAEGMSNALLEAMAVGLPVVATDVGDHAAIVRDNVEGLIVAPRCIDDLVTALTKLALTPGLGKRLGSAARVRAEDYDLSRAVRAYECWYERLLRPPRREYRPGQRAGAPCKVG